MSIDWLFPSNNGGTNDGFNDAGMEFFTGAPYDGLAREIIQNSLDAAFEGKQVSVEFDFVKIQRKDFPGQESLLKAMKKCQKQSKDEKSTEFFDNAVEQLKKPHITCLKISDSGTTGLKGDYRNHEGEWHSMIKARGSSQKSSQTAGGSYGIGKSAPFVLSEFRTVFYSTYYEDKKGSVYRAQGKSILASHPDDKDGYTQAVGFYGKVEKCMPIEDSTETCVPEILRPKAQGCVVFIPGFNPEKDWQDKIAATVVTNFFYAIDRGNLKVKIKDEHVKTQIIDKNTLDDCFKKITASKDNAGKGKRSYFYYHALKLPKSTHKDAQLPIMGHCRISILLDENLPKSSVLFGEELPKQVALIRKTGMLITDEQPWLKQWHGRKGFAAVFFCDGDEGNKLLREMETPKHDAFEPDRAILSHRAKCQKVLDELTQWVRNSVDSQAKIKETEVTELDELGKFFPDVDPPETISGDERDIEGRSIFSPRPLKRSKSRIEPPSDEEDGDDGGRNDEGGDGPGPGPDPEPTDGPGDGPGAEGKGNRNATQSVELEGVRVVANADSAKKKTIYFTPSKGGKIKVTLGIVGDDGSSEKIIVCTVDSCKMDDDKIKPNKYRIEGGDVVLDNAEASKRVSLEVEFKNSVADSIAVWASQRLTKDIGK